MRLVLKRQKNYKLFWTEYFLIMWRSYGWLAVKWAFRPQLISAGVSHATATFSNLVLCKPNWVVHKRTTSALLLTILGTWSTSTWVGMSSQQSQWLKLLKSFLKTRQFSTWICHITLSASLHHKNMNDLHLTSLKTQQYHFTKKLSTLQEKISWNSLNLIWVDSLI